MDAMDRATVSRVWKDNDARTAFENYFRDSLYWCDEKGIMDLFREKVELGPCGVILGASCVVNQAETNAWMPFPILQLPLIAEERGTRSPTVMVYPSPNLSITSDG
jgi:hypothetical protein